MIACAAVSISPFPKFPSAAWRPILPLAWMFAATLRQLKPRERELLWLAYVEGMNHDEIAAATGLRPLSIRILLFRARRKAAQLLAPPAQKSTRLA